MTWYMVDLLWALPLLVLINVNLSTRATLFISSVTPCCILPHPVTPCLILPHPVSSCHMLFYLPHPVTSVTSVTSGVITSRRFPPLRRLPPSAPDVRPRESLGPLACGLLGTTVSGLLAYGSTDELPSDLQNVITSFVTASAGMLVEFYTGLSAVVCYVPAV